MKTITTIKTLSTFKFDNEDIIRALIEADRLPVHDVRDFKVYVRVPGGGDWSSTNLDIDKDIPVEIQLEVEETKET